MRTLELINFIDAKSYLTKDVDLFYLDIPLNKAGLWLQDRQVESAKNSVDRYEYNIYVRNKDKATAIQNINYFKTWVETLDECYLTSGVTFRLEIPWTWDYLSKDSEGFYVFANTLRLTL